MAMCCPSCGRPIGRKFPQLSNTEQKIFDMIEKSGGNGMTAQDIIKKLYGYREDGGPLHARQIVGVRLHCIRKKLAGTGHNIACHNNRRYVLER